MSSSTVKLENFVDAALSRRLELTEMLAPLDYIKTQQRLHPELGFEFCEIAGGLAFYAGANSPLNQCVGMGLHGPVSPREFDDFESFFRDRNCPAQIVLSPYADGTLLQLLGERGYRITEFNSVLVCDLSKVVSQLPPSQIRIEAVTPATARLWAGVLVEGFSEYGSFPPDLFEPYGLLPHGINFLAFIGREAAGGASGTIYAEHNLAAIFGASTLPAFRNRGVQNALIQARLAAAKQTGCEIAVVCTQPGSASQRNAHRNGFRVAYTKVVMVRNW